MSNQYTIESLEAIRQRIEDEVPYHTILAGGALRDTMHCRPVKDVDVFLEDDRCDDEDWESFDRQRRYVAAVAEAFEGTWSISNEAKYTDGYGNTFATYDVQTKDGDTINLIFVFDWRTALRSFPDHISGVYLTDDGLTATPEFTEDHANKVIRYNMAQGGQDRLDRLTAKYPEYVVQELIEV